MTATTDSPLNIALIGCGRMGSAMLRGWLASKIENRIYVLDPAGLPDEFADYTPNPVVFFDDAHKFAAKAPNADIYVIAVKPQIMKDVCSAIKPAVPSGKPVLSIAAGQTIALFEGYFGAGQPVIRAMPNTPAAIGKGISVAVANAQVNKDHKDMADTLLRAVGAVEWINDESLLDAVTAVSGSGPAYVFLLIEILAAAGEKAGLDKDLAMKLARRTVIGSAALAESAEEVSAAELRKNVTSPGGTTAAALDVLMNGEWQELFDQAVTAARDRGRALAK